MRDEIRLELFKDLFIGKIDRYGLETPKAAKCVNEKLTDKVIQAHLAGRRRIGVNPFLADGGSRVKWACLDVDVIKEVWEKMDPDSRQAIEARLRLKVEEIRRRLRDELSLAPHVERSRRRGYHLWIFFEEPIDAAAVRKLFRFSGDENITVELFPKQDSQPKSTRAGSTFPSREVRSGRSEPSSSTTTSHRSRTSGEG